MPTVMVRDEICLIHSPIRCKLNLNLIDAFVWESDTNSSTESTPRMFKVGNELDKPPELGKTYSNNSIFSLIIGGHSVDPPLLEESNSLVEMEKHDIESMDLDADFMSYM